MEAAPSPKIGSIHHTLVQFNFPLSLIHNCKTSHDNYYFIIKITKRITIFEPS